jgi:hypothetical protein
MTEARDTWRSGNARPNADGGTTAFRPSALRSAAGTNSRPGGAAERAGPRDGDAKPEHSADTELSQEERQKQAEEREEAEKQRRSEELKKGLHPLQVS